MQVVRMLSICSIAVFGCVLTCRRAYEKYCSIDMGASSQLKEFRIELIKAIFNRCILVTRIVKHIMTAFEREVLRRRIKMALD